MELFTLLRNSAENYSFSGGAGIMMNVRNGEILVQQVFRIQFRNSSLGNDLGKLTNTSMIQENFFRSNNFGTLYPVQLKPFLALERHGRNY